MVLQEKTRQKLELQQSNAELERKERLMKLQVAEPQGLGGREGQGWGMQAGLRGGVLRRHSGEHARVQCIGQGSCSSHPERGKRGGAGHEEGERGGCLLR